MNKFAVCIIFQLGSALGTGRPYLARLLSSTTPPTSLAERDSICTEENAYYPIMEQCDAYIECRNWKATAKLCPGGLLFKPGLPFTDNPCAYPHDVACEGRSVTQVAKRTPEYPRLHGYFRLNDPTDCGAYKNCVGGRAYTLHCPEGLAYNEKMYHCDWPDVVDGCDVESFVGFTCPGLFSEDTDARTVLYSHPKDCRKFYACVAGKPRLGSCAEGEGFDEYTGRCEPLDYAICITD